MYHIVEVKPKSHYHLWIRFSDNAQGEVDVSHLAGKGVFSKWEEPGEFERVKIGSGGELVWGDTIDLCPDALYMKVTGKSAEEVFPALKG